MDQDFEQFLYDSGSWVVLFVEAPIESVSPAYGSITGSTPESCLTVNPEKPDSLLPSGCLVQVSECDWTTIFHQVGEWSQFETADLARQTGARVLEFNGEDTSGSVDSRLVEPDGVSERFQTADDAEAEDDLYEEADEFSGDEMEIPRPDEATIIDSYDSLFQSLGIESAVITVDESGTVSAFPEHFDRIERVDRVV